MRRPLVALTDAVATVAAFSTAVQLGLLDRIDREPASPEELARTCGANERGVRLLLGALESSGFVEQLPDGRFRPTLTGLAGFHPVIPMWEHLTDAVRTGVPLGEPYPPALALVSGLWGDSVDAAAAVLPAARRVLDVGAGAAAWSIALATRNPESLVTALELPQVMPVTRRAVGRAGLADRFDFVAAHVFETTLEPETYDLIVVAHFCTQLDVSSCEKLFRRLAPALASGGTLAVIETLSGGRDAAVQELALYLRTRGGTVHAPDCYRRWLAEVGLVEVDSVELDRSVTVITGHRADQSGFS